MQRGRLFLEKGSFPPPSLRIEQEPACQPERRGGSGDVRPTTGEEKGKGDPTPPFVCWFLRSGDVPANYSSRIPPLPTFPSEAWEERNKRVVEEEGRQPSGDSGLEGSPPPPMEPIEFFLPFLPPILFPPLSKNNLICVYTAVGRAVVRFLSSPGGTKSGIEIGASEGGSTVMDVIDMPDLRRNLRDHERRTRPPLLTRVLDGDCCVSTRSQCVLFTRYFWLYLAGTTTVTRRCFWPFLVLLCFRKRPGANLEGSS